MSSQFNQPTNNTDYASILLSKSNTTSNDQSRLIKPTIFDIMAQENMQSLFGDSFNHLFNWMAQYSRLFYRAKYYKQEIYMLLHSTVEFFYLKHYDSLFSEYFIDLLLIPIIDLSCVGCWEQAQSNKNFLETFKIES